MKSTQDLEAQAKKPKDQASSQKRHYGPERKEYQSNYTGLADLMAENPEKAIFRRFTHLNIKNLLYLQAELACLEEDLSEAIKHDKKFTDTEDYALSWILLEESDPSQGLVLDHIEATENYSSRLEESSTWQSAPVPAVGESIGQVQRGFDPPGSTLFEVTSSRRETGTSEDDIILAPTDSWPGGISHIRKQPQTLRQRESHFAKMNSGQSNEPEELSDSGRGSDHKSRQPKKSSREPNTEHHSSHSHTEKKHGTYQDQDDRTRPIQPAQFAGPSDRPLHNDAPLLQRHLVHQIRTKLEKYNKALEQVAFTFGLAKPERLDIVDLQEWLRREGFGNDFLADVEKDIWSPDYDHDRVSLSLKPGEYDDTFSTTVSKHVISVLNWIYGFLGRKSSGQMFQWNDSWLFSAISLVSTTLAACLPVLAILALYKLEGVQKGWQIGIIGFFSAFCATALALARAKRTDVFLATSAFAAVMVVFIKA